MRTIQVTSKSFISTLSSCSTSKLREAVGSSEGSGKLEDTPFRPAGFVAIQVAQFDACRIVVFAAVVGHGVDVMETIYREQTSSAGVEIT